MRLLITGGAGFIGSAVARLAVRRGHDVIVLDALTYAGRLENLDEIRDHAGFTFVKADIRDRIAVRDTIRATQPDAILHLAAESHVDRSIEGPAEFLETNVVGTFFLLEETLQWWHSVGRPQAFRFVHVSTDEVFGSLNVNDAPFSETSPYRPSSPYSASKAAADHFVWAWGCTYGLPVVITNCSNNYGPYQFPEKLIPLAILSALLCKPIPVYGTGQNVRDWLHVEDHAQALLEVASRAPAFRRYNIGGREEATNIHIVRSICRAMDLLVPDNHPHERFIRYVRDRPGHDFRYAIDPSAIEQDLGWRPSRALAEGLGETVRWYLDNRWWWQGLAVPDTAALYGLGDACES